MAEELQSLIEKINRDGVEKASAKADEIVSAAKAQAAAIVKDAKAAAEKCAADAETKAKESAERAKETMRQAARDAVVTVERAVTQLLERLLRADVDTALADPATLASVVASAVKEVAGGGEIAAGAKIAEALRAQLADRKDFKVVLDDAIGTGFSVRLDGGRVEHDFTGAAIAAEMSKRLRPELARLMAEA